MAVSILITAANAARPVVVAGALQGLQAATQVIVCYGALAVTAGATYGAVKGAKATGRAAKRAGGHIKNLFRKDETPAAPAADPTFGERVTAKLAEEAAQEVARQEAAAAAATTQTRRTKKAA